jgi:diacylglycerol kinase family enzyme
MERALVLMNSGAGTVVRSGEDPLAPVRAALAEAGVSAEVSCVPGASLREIALGARARGFDVVVAAGGDGTIGTVASALVRTDMPLGVLPLGTRNHFARDIGMPSDLPAAAAALRTALPRRIDVGEVNGRTFVNNASIGLYPQIVQERDERRLRSGMAKGPATLLATVAAMRRFWLVRVGIEVEGQHVVIETPFVFVGNNAYRMNLLDLGARDVLDAGHLSLYTAHCKNRGSLLRLAAAALVGRLDQSRDFESRDVDEATVEASRRLMRVALDGEILRMKPPLVFRSHPGALTVLAPPAAA